MKTKSKAVLENERKEAQIKNLIGRALKYYEPADLFDMLIEQMSDKTDLYDKCAELVTSDGNMIIECNSMITENELKHFCKENDILIKTNYDFI